MKRSLRSSDVGAALLIVLLTVAAYHPMLDAGFIWDDDSYVTQNETLRSFQGLQQIWTKLGVTKQYYPLVFTSFWAEYHLWKLDPLGYHLVNILLHALNAILLWCVLRRLELPGAWWVAAIFAVHPIEVESVAWVAERKNVLSGAFYFLALLAYLRFRPLTGETTATHRRDWRFYPFIIAFFLCALFSKTVTLTLPAVILLLVWWKTARLRWRDVGEMVPLFALGAGVGQITAWMEKHNVGASGADWAFSPLQRCLIVGRAAWFYVGKLIWPHPLAFVYPRWTVDSHVWWGYLFPLTALVVLGALWMSRKKIGRGPLVAVLCFAGTLVPALGFFDVYPFRYSFVADHFQYLAGIALMGLVVVGVVKVCLPYGERGRYVGMFVGGAMLAILGFTTWSQAFIYRDVETLWLDTLAKNPDCWMAYLNLGDIQLGAGNVSRAIDFYRRALQIKPDFVEGHNNLGNALLRDGKVADAIDQYKLALQTRPDAAKTRNNLANALLRAGKVEDAVSEYEETLRIQPALVEAHYNYAGALLRLGRVKEAIIQYRETLQQNPNFLPALRALAWILAAHEDANFRNAQEAIPLAERLCAVTRYQYAEGMDVLAAAYAEGGRFSEAVQTARQAIDVANAAGHAELAGHIQERLNLYQAGHPYHEEPKSAPAS